MVIELFLTLLSSLNFAKSASFLDSTEAERLTTDTVVANVNSLSNGGFTEISDGGSVMLSDGTVVAAAGS